MSLIVSESRSSRDEEEEHSSVTQALLSDSEKEAAGDREDREADLSGQHGDSSGRFPPSLSVENEEGSSSSWQQSRIIPGQSERHPADLELQNIKSRPNAECQAKTLSWLTCPVTNAEEDTPLPTVSVFAEPEVTDELELIVHSNGEGTAQVSGKKIASLRSQGSLRPSVASFENIRIKRAGLYVIEVRYVRNPEISLVADHPTDVVAKISSHNSLSDGSLPEDCGLGAAMWTDYS